MSRWRLHFYKYNRWHKREFDRLDQAYDYLDRLNEWSHACIMFIETGEFVKKFVCLLGKKVEI